MTLSIYHNPKCSKSRKTLDILQENKQKIKVIQYLLEATDHKEIIQIAEMLNEDVSSLMRIKEIPSESKESILSMDNISLSKWLSSHPRFIERPIVINHKNNRAVICRPPERVLEII